MTMKNKPLKKQLSAQFYHRNIPVLCVAVFGALVSGSLNLILSWIMQQLIDAASGVPGALAIGTLAKISGGFVLLCVAAFLLDYISQPRFIERAMRQYKDFAFQKLMEKSISSFRDESTAAYLSALTNDAGSIEADYLAQQLSLITKTVTFIGALAMMLWYSPVMTAIAIGVTILPLVASLLTGNKLQSVCRSETRTLPPRCTTASADSRSLRASRRRRRSISSLPKATGLWREISSANGGSRSSWV